MQDLIISSAFLFSFNALNILSDNDQINNNSNNKFNNAFHNVKCYNTGFLLNTRVICNDSFAISLYNKIHKRNERVQIIYYPRCREFVNILQKHFNVTLFFNEKEYDIKNKSLIISKFNNITHTDLRNFNKNKIYLCHKYNKYICDAITNSENLLYYNKQIKINYEANTSNLCKIANEIVDFIQQKQKELFPDLHPTIHHNLQRAVQIIPLSTLNEHFSEDATSIAGNSSKDTIVLPQIQKMHEKINVNIKHNNILVILDMDSTILYRYSYTKFVVRPHLEILIDELDKMKIDVIIWTAADEIHAKDILNSIDCVKDKHKIYNDKCRIINKLLYKDLSMINYPLEKIIIVDDITHFFSLQPENGYNIRPFCGTISEIKHDIELLKLIDFIKEINKKSCVEARGE